MLEYEFVSWLDAITRQEAGERSSAHPADLGANRSSDRRRRFRS